MEPRSPRSDLVQGQGRGGVRGHPPAHMRVRHSGTAPQLRLLLLGLLTKRPRNQAERQEHAAGGEGQRQRRVETCSTHDHHSLVILL